MGRSPPTSHHDFSPNAVRCKHIEFDHSHFTCAPTNLIGRSLKTFSHSPDHSPWQRFTLGSRSVCQKYQRRCHQHYDHYQHHHHHHYDHFQHHHNYHHHHHSHYHHRDHHHRCQHHQAHHTRCQQASRPPSPSSRRSWTLCWSAPIPGFDLSVFIYSRFSFDLGNKLSLLIIPTRGARRCSSRTTSPRSPSSRTS